MKITTGLKIGVLVGLSIILWGCQGENSNQTSLNDDKPDVVATSTIIADWVAQIGGDTIDLTPLLKPGDDPHIYEPVPQDSIALEEAELILYNGYHLEPNLIKMIQATGIKGQKVAVGEIIEPLTLNYEGQTLPDPHVWGNVANAVKMVELIRDQLIQLSPENKDQLNQNAGQLILELQQLDRWIKEQIKTIPEDKRQLVTTHDAFQYYAQAYGLEVAGTLIGISTEEQPSAKTVQSLVESIKQLNIPVIFAESTINPRLITTVAQEAGVKLATTPLYADSLGAIDSEGDTYIKMMQSNTRNIVENLAEK